MADGIVLEWSRDRLRVLSVSASGGGWNVRAAAVRLGTEHADPQVSVPEAAELLKTWLKENHVPAGRVHVVLPREMVVVRLLQLPQAPVDELPDLVRFQAATRTSAPMDSLALDFLPLTSAVDATGQEVTTVTTDRDRLARIQLVCEAAGLEILQVTITSLGAGRVVRAVEAPHLGLSEADLVLSQDGNHLELSIFNQGTLVFSHGTERPEGDDLKPLKSELTRSIVALNQVHPKVTLRHCYYLSGHADPALMDLLRERFGTGYHQVHTATLLQGESAAEYAPLLGVLLPESDERLRLDLLHPRRKRIVPDRRRLYAGAGAGLLALIVLVGCWIFYAQKSALEASISSLQQSVSTQEEQMLKGKPRADAYARIARWKEADTDPIELWNVLRTCLPSTERLYFWELRITPLQGENLARFVGRGRARSRDDIEALNQTLSDHGFRVRPTTSTLGKRDPAYPREFDLDVELPRAKVSSTPPPQTKPMALKSTTP